MNEKLKVSIVGTSGYAGGELLRMLMFRPHVELKQASAPADRIRKRAFMYI